MLGAVSQVGQVVLLREFLMAFHGNEFSIGIVLAAWLAWVGVGSRLGAYWIDRTYRPRFALAINASALLLVLPVTIFLIRNLRGFFRILPGAYLSLLDMTISSFLLMAPVCLLLGAQFVLLSRAWRESDRANDTSGAGKTYVGEAAGNMLGGILFTFLIVRYLNSFQSAVLAASLMLGAVLLITKRQACPGRPIFWVLLLMAALAFPFLSSVDDWAYRIQWRHLAPEHQLVGTYQSKHGTIAVVRREHQYTFFQSGHLLFSTAGPDAVAPGLEEQDAVIFTHLAMVQHPAPARVLLIGGGLSGVLSEMVKYPVESIDYIELDEVLTRAARPYVSPGTVVALADSRVRLIHADGRLFVKTTREQYDLIVVNAPDPVTAVLNRYYTQEFFVEARSRLRPGGVLVTGAVSTPDLRQTAVANRNATIYHTLASAFSQVLLAGDRFLIYVATDVFGQASVDVPTLQQRYRHWNIPGDGFSILHYYTVLQPSQLWRVNWILRHHGRSRDAHLVGPGPLPLSPGPVAPAGPAEEELPPVNQRYFINADFRPIGYYYTLMFWDDLTRAGHGTTLLWLLRIEPWWMLPLAAIPLLVVMGLRISTRRAKTPLDTGFAVLFAVLTTGLSTMALQIAILFSFQSIYGFVYETVGLIVAMFMGGLALGALFTHRYVVSKAGLGVLTAFQLLIALWASLMALALPRAAMVQSPGLVFVLFSVLTFTAGLINGVDFPLSAACYLPLRKRAEAAIAAVYGVELFGACLGAALAGAVVAPVLGIVYCCLFAAVANATAFVVLLISRRSYPCPVRP